jgi:type IV pilus assembly protein PilY1
MKRSTRTRLMLFVLLAFLSIIGAADDTDIFNQPPSSSSPAPNILFIIDNRSNWSDQNQQWPNGSSQGQSEVSAIKSLLANLKQPANVGLMMLDTVNHDGGFVRYGIRNINDTSNNAAMANILTNIYNNITSPSLKVPMAQGDFANALYESWLYLTGANSWEGMAALADYSGNGGGGFPTPSSQGLSSGFAYASGANGAAYNSPIASGSCAHTYIIFIGNNNKGILPEVPASTDPAITTLKKYGYTTSPDVQSAWTRFLRMRPDLGSNAANGAVITYTIDAYHAQQNPTFSTMLQNMAHDGGGQYFVANDDVSMQSALQQIFNQIQAVNSVFSSVSLPVSVSIRSTYLNQVYMGVFRPDANAKPNWAGNLKQYQLGVNTATNPPTLFLADSTGANAENPNTGFINSNATSFWTTASSFWDPNYYSNLQGVGGQSDSPDGDLVEKGGAAEFLRTTYANGSTTRKLYTYTGTGSCPSASTSALLSSCPFNSTNVTTQMLTPAGASTISSSEQQYIISWVQGGNTSFVPNNTTPSSPLVGDDNPSGSPSAVRGELHGDVLHSRPAVINYGRTSDDIMVYYGANDGILHAVKGGQPAVGTTTQDGQEQWGFIAPEFLSQLKRMRDHSPTISSTNPKPYFFDGSITTYTVPSNSATGVIDSTQGGKAYLFVTMRRGGRFMYALDVSDPANPKFLWKHNNTDSGFGELGYTWSDLRVAKLKAFSDPVLIAGMGYDKDANDPTTQGTATMGRGIMIIDALTGQLLWQAGPGPVAGSTVTPNLTVPGMTYAIAASLELVDSDGDGNIDRVYAADTGANVWRLNVDDANPANWTISKLASLGGTGASARKFLYPPDVVLASATQPYDAVLLGSGDREHPFDTTIVNQFYMLEDHHDLNYVWSTPITQTSMYDATADLLQVGTTSQQQAAQTALLSSSNQGWFVTLGTGEKVVGGATTLNGTVIFGTNLPATSSTYTCTSNLGEARLYSLNYLTGGATVDQDQNGTLTPSDRYTMLPGGGFPPTPVPVSVVINGRTYQAAISGTNVVSAPGPGLGRRYRTYWYRTID